MGGGESKPEMRKRQEGYECKFIEPPPKEFQSECPICLLVLHLPHQVTCCGKSFCKVCIEKVQTKKSSCPMCKQSGFTIYPNKGLQQSLSQYKVCCENEEKGCKWMGELGELDRHLNNIDPQPDNWLTGCDFAEIPCVYCKNVFQRCDIRTHHDESCPKRPFNCDHCGNYKSNYEDVATKHWPVCNSYPVACPNECGESPKRLNLQHHIDKECPLTVIDCDFHRMGCDVQLQRIKMPIHLAEYVSEHLSLMAVYSEDREKEKAAQTMNKIQECSKDLRREIDRVRKKAELTDSLRQDLRRDVEQIRRKAEMTESLRQELGRTIDRVKSKTETMNKELKRDIDQVSSEAGSVRQDLERKVAGLEEHQARFEEKLGGYQQASNQQGGVAEVLEQRMRDKDGEIKELRRQVEALRVEAEEFNGQIRAVKKILWHVVVPVLTAVVAVVIMSVLRALWQQ